jgi:hypothetical protein
MIGNKYANVLPLPVRLHAKTSLRFGDNNNGIVWHCIEDGLRIPNLFNAVVNQLLKPNDENESLIFEHFF